MISNSRQQSLVLKATWPRGKGCTSAVSILVFNAQKANLAFCSSIAKGCVLINPRYWRIYYGWFYESRLSSVAENISNRWENLVFHSRFAASITRCLEIFRCYLLSLSDSLQVALYRSSESTMNHLRLLQNCGCLVTTSLTPYTDVLPVYKNRNYSMY